MCCSCIEPFIEPRPLRTAHVSACQYASVLASARQCLMGRVVLPRSRTEANKESYRAFTSTWQITESPDASRLTLISRASVPSSRRVKELYLSSQFTSAVPVYKISALCSASHETARPW